MPDLLHIRNCAANQANAQLTKMCKNAQKWQVSCTFFSLRLLCNLLTRRVNIWQRKCRKFALQLFAVCNRVAFPFLPRRWCPTSYCIIWVLLLPVHLDLFNANSSCVFGRQWPVKLVKAVFCIAFSTYFSTVLNKQFLSYDDCGVNRRKKESTYSQMGLTWLLPPFRMYVNHFQRENGYSLVQTSLKMTTLTAKVSISLVGASICFRQVLTESKCSYWGNFLTHLNLRAIPLVAAFFLKKKANTKIIQVISNETEH